MKEKVYIKSIDNQKEAKEISEEEETLKQLADDTIKSETKGLFSLPVFKQINFLFKLFFTKKFISHRLGGLNYLIQWFLALGWWIYDYDSFKDSLLIWSLPLSGVFQSLNAMSVFWFLPKNTKETGYFSDKKTMSYSFIKENSFFALLLLFQFTYFNNYFFEIYKKTFIFELIFVFLPYFFRPLWPKTSFRDSKGKENKSEKNFGFYSYAIVVTKCVYVWGVNLGKHFFGFYLNYVRFLNRLNEDHKKSLYLSLIFGCAAVSD
ncbi:hypothetical protein HDU92_004139 [Lobulomyces angularis]|nr:hypothetical protein HDU92_004139 [Lobulomyces angularis]